MYKVDLNSDIGESFGAYNMGDDAAVMDAVTSANVACAFHAGGGTSHKVKAQRLFYSLRSRLLYGFKHFSIWQARVLVLVTLAIEPVTRTIFSAASGSESVFNIWRGYGMLYRDLPKILRRVRHS